MSLHVSVSGWKPFCGQVGKNLTTIPIGLFVKRMELMKFRGMLCSKCKYRLRKGAPTVNP